jgi:polysaccharide biosynthesis transport protein
MATEVTSADSLGPKPGAWRRGSPQGMPPGAGAPTSADESWDIIRLLSRTLRGRYRLTFALSVVAAGIGAAAGWTCAGPLYRSDSMVRITSTTPAALQQNDQAQPIPMSDSFMEAQQGLITSRSLLEKAAADPIWESKGLGNNRPSVSEMAANLKVDVRAKSENLRISYVDSVAAVASAAVASTISAYQTAFAQENQKLDQQRLQSLQDYRGVLTKQLDQEKIDNRPKSEAPPTTQRVATTEPAAPVAAVEPTALTPSWSEFEQPSSAKVALVDPVMARLIDRRDDARDQLKEALAVLGPNHPSVLRLTQAYELSSERIEQHLNEYLSLHAAIATDAVKPPVAVATVIAPSPQPPVVAAVTTTAPPPPSASMVQLQDELDRVNRRIELLKNEAAIPKRFKIIDVGDLPVSLPNRQIKWTVTGGGIGGGFALGIMVLLGLHNTRYRVCADVMEHVGKKLRFVAAVPHLTAASKPRHLVDAAQSIHHFRNKLDQNGSVFMVTSADWGEGRTSVVMSLALSLCSGGARTLVIDADLATRGLTHSLNMDNLPGFFEMVQDGDSVAPLNVPRNNLAILPVGAAGEADGLSVSAAAVARLLERLKPQFDVILIDAGPALRRVETCLMARQVDGVLLTIGCGQERSIWTRTLEELESVAVVHSAVFNRVKPRDFDRSVRQRSGAQVTVLPRPIVGPIGNFGPLVHAVATSLPQDIKLFPIGDGKADVRKAA